MGVLISGLLGRLYLSLCPYIFTLSAYSYTVKTVTNPISETSADIYNKTRHIPGDNNLHFILI
jgi:hypothetical protein